MHGGRARSTAIAAVAAFALLWGLAAAIVNPSADFPLIDDWSFASTVRHLLQHGDFRPAGWTAMPLITNIAWGSLFCIPAGFSFNALRLSTLTAAFLGVVCVYFLEIDVGQPPLR